jgi:hypothetical protein
MAWYKGEWVETNADQIDVHSWCPECAPDGVPEPWTLAPCALHLPSVDGSADIRARGVDGAYWSSGSSEAGGESNAAWCKVLHGR